MASISVSPTTVARGGSLTITIQGSPLSTYYPFTTKPDILANVSQNAQPVSTNPNGVGTTTWYIASGAPLGTFDIRLSDASGWTVSQTTVTVSTTSSGGGGGGGGGGTQPQPQPQPEPEPTYNGLAATASVKSDKVEFAAQLINTSTGQSIAKSGVHINVNVDGFHAGLTMTTDSQGRATGSLPLKNYSAGSHSAYLYLDQYPLSGMTLSFVVPELPVTVGNVTLMANRSQIFPSDNKVTFTAKVTDSTGKPMSSATGRMIINGAPTAGMTLPTDSTGTTVFTIPLDVYNSLSHSVAVEFAGVQSNVIIIEVIIPEDPTYPGGGGGGGGGGFPQLPQVDPLMVAAGAGVGAAILGIATGIIKLPKLK